MRRQAGLHARPRGGALARALLGHLAAIAAGAAPLASGVEQRHRRGGEPLAAAVGATERDLVRHALARPEHRRQILSRCEIRQKLADGLADQRMGGPAEREMRRDEAEPADTIGLPDKVAGELGEILIAL